MAFPSGGTGIISIPTSIGKLAFEPCHRSLKCFPAIAGILLIFGAVRKELILLTLVAIYGTNVALVFNPAQFIVLALVGVIYFPCIATIGILAKEFGWKAAAAISAANLALALLIGGIVVRLLTLVF